MAETTVVGLAVIETTVITDEQGNTVGESGTFRSATPDEIAQVLSAAQSGEASVSMAVIGQAV